MTIRKRRGSLYILVVIIITISTSMIIMLYTRSKVTLDTSINYSQYSNNYYMANSGAKRLEGILNSDLYTEIDSIIEDTNIRISRNDYEEYLYYEDNQFYFKRRNSNYEIGDLNKYYKDMVLRQFYYRFPQHYYGTFGYTIENTIDKYFVEVNYRVVNDDFFVKSRVENLNNGTSSEVECKIILESGYEKVDLNFNWRSIIPLFSYGIVCNKIILDEVSILDGNLEENYHLNYIDYNFNEESNILIRDKIDISTLSDEYYIIFSKNDLKLTNSNNKDFKGVIISLNDIYFLEYNGKISGNIIAKNNMHLNNSNVKFIKEEEAIFKVNYRSCKNYFSILDSLGITNFKNTNNKVDTKNGIRNILDNVEIESIKNVKLESLQFQIIELIKN